MKPTLCPLCILDYGGSFADEPHDFVVNDIKFETCEEHEQNRDMTVYAKAANILRKAHENCSCVTGE